MTISEFYKYTEKKLNLLNTESLKYEIRVMIEHYLKLSTTDILLNKNQEIPSNKLELLLDAVEKRLQGFPLQYILGIWSFMDIDLLVGEGVLIPREDTQVLVETAILELKNLEKIKAVDLCSGTGCISFALERYFNDKLDMYAIELSSDAYKYLCENIKRLNSNVKAINEDIFVVYKNFENNYFDCVISNPPYIRSKDIEFLQTEVLKEPKIALDGGKDGLDFYRNICHTWFSKIKPGGILAFEIGIGQFEDVRNIMINSGLKLINFKKDINNIIRVITGIK